MGRGRNIQIGTSLNSNSYRARQSANLNFAQTSNIIDSWPADICAANIREFRKLQRKEKITYRKTNDLLNEMFSNVRRSPKRMLGKYYDLILALPKDTVSGWVNGECWSPLDYTKGHFGSIAQKELIKYLDSDQCPIPSENKRKQLKRHLNLSYREARR